MKFSTILVFLAAASVAQASGVKSPVTKCTNGGAGEGLSTVQFYSLSTAAPGGPVSTRLFASASQSWLGGTHYSGDVEVQASVGTDGKQGLYYSADKSFQLTVITLKANADGGTTEFNIFGTFVDPRTKMKGHVNPGTYKCSTRDSNAPN
jgi:hypothetical protein